MTQVLIDTKVVKNALAAVDKFCLKVQTGQARSVETYHDLMLVGNDLRAALANAARVEPEDGCAPNHMCNGHRVHIPTGECCNKCGATSW